MYRKAGVGKEQLKGPSIAPIVPVAQREEIRKLNREFAKKIVLKKTTIIIKQDEDNEDRSLPGEK